MIDHNPEESADFSILLGPEPTWLTCMCGALTARVPCWDCSRAHERDSRARDDRQLALGTIPPRFSWARLGTLELSDRVRAREPLETLSKRILASQRVVFAGPSGAGKTSLAVACLRERVPHGIYVSAMKLGTVRIQSAAGDGEASLVQRAMTAPLLLLDEVGGEAKTATNALKDVIWERMDNELPTWVTTGFRGEQLAEMYGDGLYRRLTENATIVRLGAKP